MRLDYRKICSLINSKSKVLDLGCGNGDLLQLLFHYKNIDGSGIEIEPDRIQESIAKGLSVIQGDLEEIVKDYPDKMFDYVILSQTLQELSHPSETLRNMIRIGKKALIAFYNLAFWQYRLYILFRGSFPKSKDLPYSWLSSNISFLSVKDFRDFCTGNNIIITQAFYLTDEKLVKSLPNLRAKICVFEIKQK